METISITKGPSNGNHQHSLRITSGTIPRHSLQHPPRRLKPVVENQVWCTDEKQHLWSTSYGTHLEQKEKNKKNNKEWR